MRLLPKTPGPRPVPSAGRAGAPRSGTASRVGAGRWTGRAEYADIGLRFRYDEFDIRELPAGTHSGVVVPASLTDQGVHDGHGVRMYRVDGTLRDHPVGQAQYGMYLVETYRVTGDRRYLDRAVMQAQRLVDRRVVHRGGWFYPYAFVTGLHNGPERFRAPWFSMMAQGQALSLFCRLVEVTDHARWRAAADATFGSYLVPPVADRPWGIYVIDGLLWLEEYPFPTKVTGDRTYNGHNFSALGLWDYWALTKHEYARLLLRAALTTARDVFPQIRNPGWTSKYCLRHGFDLQSYHVIHMTQHSQFYAITGDLVFAHIADVFYDDSPPSEAGGRVSFARGRHTGYEFDRDGRIVSRKIMSLSRPDSAPSLGRVRIRRQTGMWYAIGGGRSAGYHVRESTTAFRLGICALLSYRIPRPGGVPAAPVIAHAVHDGAETTTMATNYRVGDPVTVDARAVLNGVSQLRLASGEHTNRWIPDRHRPPPSSANNTFGHHV